ncbi:hypothetical protein [Neobacillus cucumis]|nr:hypothetical protein [Neobacillus cucumis]MBM7655696.1 hypothetical protein [Neobacillus cucumis]
MPFFSKEKKQNNDAAAQVFIGGDFDARYKWLKQSAEGCRPSRG